MERVYESGAAAGAPSAPATPSTGYPTAGNPGSGIEATKPGAYWFHMIMEELRAVITAAGIVPDHEDLGQLLAALQGGFGLAKTLSVPGYITLPGGMIMQFVSGVPQSTVLFPVAFPTQCFGVAPTVGSIATLGTAGAYGWAESITLSSFYYRQASRSADSVSGGDVNLCIALGK